MRQFVSHFCAKFIISSKCRVSNWVIKPNEIDVKRKFYWNWWNSPHFNHFWCRCLDKSQFFPPGRSIWCNNNRKGPTARPTAPVGGHACCGTADFCNTHLKPIILDYRKTPVKEYIQGGIFAYTHTHPLAPPSK